jgi:prophage regulatory protein
MTDIRIVRLPSVVERTGLSARTIRRLVETGSFPAPVKLSRQAIGWSSEALDAWIRGRIENVNHRG